MNILFYDRLKAGQLITISTHKYELISNLSRLGHNVALLNADYPRGVGDVICRIPSSLDRGVSSRLLSWRIVRRLRGGIGILWTLGRDICLFLAALILIIGQKRSFDVIYRRHSLFNSDYLLARLFRLPLVKEVNGLESVNAQMTRFTDCISLWLIGKIEKYNLPRADKIIVVTAKLKETLQQDYGVPENKIAVIHNGANIELFKPMNAQQVRRRLNLPQTAYLVVFAGDLVAWQGVACLIKSAPYVVEKIPETRFLIVGDGMMRQELVELAGRLGVFDKVIFTGMVPYQDVPLYINAGNVCIAPFAASRDEKIGLSPLKLYEYMACGKPVIASRISGLEVVEENNAGIVVAPDSPTELAQAIVRLLQDKELGRQMGRRGQEYVVENQSWGSVARRVAEVLEQTGKAKTACSEAAN